MRRRTTLVLTEHADYLTPERRERYETVRARLEEAADSPVDVVHYLDADGLADSETLVLSGSSAPWAAHDPAALARLGEVVSASARPVLGICAGMQLMAEWGGGTVRPMAERGANPERGFLAVEVVEREGLLAGLPGRATVFQDHRDEVTELPPEFRVLARSEAASVQAVASRTRPWWGTQFHPEWWDDEHRDGDRVLRNFFALARL